MAFQLVTTVGRYFCLAADTKTTTGVNLGSSCHQLDTGKNFYFNGTVWVQENEGNTELGLTELIGVNEQVDSTNYGASVGIALAATESGSILTVLLVSKETGTGAVQTPAGQLIFFDADPEITANLAAMSAAAADHAKIIGHIEVLVADWKSDTSGAYAFLITNIPFHSIGTLYATWRMASGSAMNDAAGDDEQLLFNAWYRRG